MQRRNTKESQAVKTQFENFIQKQKAVNPNYNEAPVRAQLDALLSGAVNDSNFEVSVKPSWGVIPGSIRGADKAGAVPPFLEVNIQGTTYPPSEASDKQIEDFVPYSTTVTTHIGASGEQFFMGHAVSGYVEEGVEAPSMNIFMKGVRGGLEMQSRKTLTGGFPGPEKGSLDNQMQSSVFQVLTQGPEEFMPVEKSFLSFVGYNQHQTPFYASASHLVTPASEGDRRSLMYFNEDGQFAFKHNVFEVLPGETVQEENGLFSFAGKQTGVGKNFKQAVHIQSDYDEEPYGRSFVVSSGQSYGISSPRVQFGVALPFWVGEQGGSGAALKNTEVEHPQLYDVRRRQINAYGGAFKDENIFYKMFDIAANGLTKDNSFLGIDDDGEELKMDLSKASMKRAELQTGVFQGHSSQQVWFEEAKAQWIADNPEADVPNLTWQSGGKIINEDPESTPITFNGIFRDPISPEENQNMKSTSLKALTQNSDFSEKFVTESSREASYAYNAENFKAAGPFMVEMVDAGLRTIHRDLVEKGANPKEASATVSGILQSAGIETFGPHGVNYEVKTRQDLEGMHALYTAMHNATEEFNGDKDAAMKVFGDNTQIDEDSKDPTTREMFGERKFWEIRGLAEDAGIKGVHKETITEDKAAFDVNLGITDAHAYAYIAPDLSNVDFSGIEPGGGIKHPGEYEGPMLEIFSRADQLAKAKAEKFEGKKYEEFTRQEQLDAARNEKFEGERYVSFNRREQLQAAMDEEFTGQKYEQYDNEDEIEKYLEGAYKVDKDTGKTYYDPSVADSAPRFRISTRETKEYRRFKKQKAALPKNAPDLMKETDEFREYNERMRSLPTRAPLLTRETKEYHEYRKRMAALPENTPMLIRETKEYREHKKAEALYWEAKDARIARVKAKMQRQMEARAELAQAKRDQGWDIPEAGQFADKTQINMRMRGRGIAIEAKMDADVIHFAHAPTPRRSIQYNRGPLKKGVSTNVLEQVEYMIPGEGVEMTKRSIADKQGRQVGAMSLVASTIKRTDAATGGLTYGARMNESVTPLVHIGKDNPENAIAYAAAVKKAEEAYKEEYGVKGLPAEGAPARFIMAALKDEFGSNAQFRFDVDGGFSRKEPVRDRNGVIQRYPDGKPKTRSTHYNSLSVVTPTLKAVERSFSSQPKVLGSFTNMLQLASTGSDEESIRLAHERFQKSVESQVLDDNGHVRKEMAKTASSAFPGGVMGGKHQVDRAVKPGEMDASLGWLHKQYLGLKDYYEEEGMTFSDYMTAVTRGEIYNIVDRAPDQRAENAELLKVNYNSKLKGETTRISNSTNVSHTSDNDDDSFIAIPLTMHKDAKGNWSNGREVREAWQRRYEEPNKWLTQRHPEDVTGLERRAQMYELTGELSEALGDLEKANKPQMKGFADIDTMRTTPSTKAERAAIEREAANKERMRKNYKMASLATASAVQYKDLFAPRLTQEETDSVSNQFSKAYQYAIDKTETHLNNIIDTMSNSIYKNGRVMTRPGEGGKYQDAYVPIISDMVALVETGAMSPENTEALLRYGSDDVNQGLLDTLQKVADGDLKGGEAFRAVATEHGGLGDRRFWDESLTGSWLSYMKQKKFESGGLEEESGAGMLGRTFPLNNNDTPEGFLANILERSEVSAVTKASALAAGSSAFIGRTTAAIRSRNAIEKERSEGTDKANETIAAFEKAQGVAAEMPEDAATVVKNNPDTHGIGALNLEGFGPPPDPADLIEPPDPADLIEPPDPADLVEPPEITAGGNGTGGGPPAGTTTPPNSDDDDDKKGKGKKNGKKGKGKKGKGKKGKKKKRKETDAVVDDKRASIDVIRLIDETVRAKQRASREQREEYRVKDLREKYSPESIANAMTHYEGGHERLIGALRNADNKFTEIGDDPRHPSSEGIMKDTDTALKDFGSRISLLSDYGAVLDDEIGSINTEMQERMVKQGHKTTEAAFNDPANSDLAKRYEDAKDTKKIVEREQNKFLTEDSKRLAMQVAAKKQTLKEVGYEARLGGTESEESEAYTRKMSHRKRVQRDWADRQQQDAFEKKLTKFRKGKKFGRIKDGVAAGNIDKATAGAQQIMKEMEGLTPGTNEYGKKLSQLNAVLATGASSHVGVFTTAADMKAEAQGFGISNPLSGIKMPDLQAFSQQQMAAKELAYEHAMRSDGGAAEKKLAITEKAEKLRSTAKLTDKTISSFNARVSGAVTDARSKITRTAASLRPGSDKYGDMVTDINAILSSGGKNSGSYMQAAELNRQARELGMAEPFPSIDTDSVVAFTEMKEQADSMSFKHVAARTADSPEERAKQKASAKELERQKRKQSSAADSLVGDYDKHKRKINKLGGIKFDRKSEDDLEELHKHPELFTEAEAKKILQIARPAAEASRKIREYQEKSRDAVSNLQGRLADAKGTPAEASIRDMHDKAEMLQRNSILSGMTVVGADEIYDRAEGSFQNYQMKVGVYDLAKEKDRSAALKSARKNLEREGSYDHLTAMRKAGTQRENIETVGKGATDLNKEIKDFAHAMGKSTRALEPYAETTVELTKRAKAMIDRYDRIDKQLAHTEKNITDRNVTFRDEADKDKDPSLAGHALGSRARVEAYANLHGRTDILDSLKEEDEIKAARSKNMDEVRDLEDFVEVMDARKATEDPDLATRVNNRKKSGGNRDRSGLGGLGFALFNAQRINRWTFGAATSWGKQYASDQQLLTQAMYNRTGEVNTSKATRMFYDMEAAPSRLRSRLGEVWMERYGEGWIDRITGLANQPDERLAPITDTAMWGGGALMGQLALSTLGNMTGAKWLGNLGPIGLASTVGQKGASVVGNKLLENTQVASGYAASGIWGGMKGALGALGGVGIGSGGLTLGAVGAVAAPVLAAGAVMYGGYKAYQAGDRNREQARDAFEDYISTKEVGENEKAYITSGTGITYNDEIDELYRDYAKERNAVTGGLDGKSNFWENITRGFEAGGAGTAWANLGVASLVSESADEAIGEYSKAADTAMGKYTPELSADVRKRLIDKGHDPKNVNNLVKKLDSMSDDELKDFLEKDSRSAKFKKDIEEWSSRHELSFGQGYSIAIEYEKMTGSEITKDKFSEYAETARGYGGNIGELMGIQQSILSQSGAVMGTDAYNKAMSQLGPITAVNAPAMQFAAAEANKYGIAGGMSPEQIITLAQNNAYELQSMTPQELSLRNARTRTLSPGYQMLGIRGKNISKSGALDPYISEWNQEEEERWAGGGGLAANIVSTYGDLSLGGRANETSRIQMLTDPRGAMRQGMSLSADISKYLRGIGKVRTGVTDEQAYDYETRRLGTAGFGLSLDIGDQALRSQIDFDHPANDLLGNQFSKMFASTIAGLPGIEDDPRLKERLDKAISSGKYGRDTIQRSLAGINSRTLQGDSVGTDRYTRGFLEDIGYSTPAMSGEPAYDSLGNKWSEFHEWTQDGTTYSPMYEYNSQMQRFGLESQRAQGAYGIYKSEWQIKNLQREYHASSSGRNLWDINADRAKLAKNTDIGGKEKSAKMKSLDVEQQSLGLAQQEYQIRRDMWEQSVGFQKQGIQLQRQSLALQKEEHGFQRKFSLSEKKAERGMKMIERGWQHEDFDIQTNRFEVKADWQLEDVNRNIRYSFGRQRLDLLRKKKRMITEQNWSREDRGRAIDRRTVKEGYEDERWEKYLGYEEKMEEFAQRRFSISEAQLNLQEAQLDAQVAAQKKLNDIEDQRFKDTVTFHQGEIGHLEKILEIDKKRQAYLEANFDKLMANIDHWVDTILAKLKENEKPPPPPGPNEGTSEEDKFKYNTGGQKGTSKSSGSSGGTLPTGGNGSSGAYGGGYVVPPDSPTSTIKVELELAADGESFGTTTFFIDAVQAANQMGESI